MAFWEGMGEDDSKRQKRGRKRNIKTENKMY